MGKHILKTAVSLAMAAAVLFSAAAYAAGEAPSYSAAAEAAAPRVTVETETIVQGEHFAVRVDLGEGSVAAAAAVYTSGLQFLYTTSDVLCTQNQLMLIQQLPSVVYHYKVTAGPQENVSFGLGGTALLFTEDGQEEPAPPYAWTGKVSGKKPQATPAPSTAPQPTIRPQGPLVVSGSTGIEVRGDLATNKPIDVTFSTTEDGLDARIVTKGLEFVEADSVFCSPSEVVLVKDEASQVTSATYMYVVTAGPGEEVSIDVTDVTLSVNGNDQPGTASAWINWVSDGQSAPTASPTRNPGTHAFSVSGGLSVTALQSGRTAVVGRDVTRTAQSVQSFLASVKPPAGGRAEIVSPQETVLAGSAPVTTGCELRIYDASGQLVDQAVVALHGDVRGSGVMDVGQIVQAAGYLNASRTPTELQQYCADMNRNGRTDITDLVRMASALH